MNNLQQGFLRWFRDPIQVPRIENRVPRISENYHRVPRIRENRIPTGLYLVSDIFLKRTLIYNKNIKHCLIYGYIISFPGLLGNVFCNHTKLSIRIFSKSQF